MKYGPSSTTQKTNKMSNTDPSNKPGAMLKPGTRSD